MVQGIRAKLEFEELVKGDNDKLLLLLTTTTTTTMTMLLLILRKLMIAKLRMTVEIGRV